MELVHEILTKRIHTTKRDLFYCDPKLFVDQVWGDALVAALVPVVVACDRLTTCVVVCRRRVTLYSKMLLAWRAAPARLFTLLPLRR